MSLTRRDAGGLRTPLIVSWPRGVAGRGAIRSQDVDVIDIALQGRP